MSAEIDPGAIEAAARRHYEAFSDMLDKSGTGPFDPPRWAELPVDLRSRFMALMNAAINAFLSTRGNPP